jgi:hypothetical protein
MTAMELVLHTTNNKKGLEMFDAVAYCIVLIVALMLFAMWLNNRVTQEILDDERSARDIPERKRYEIGGDL